MLDGAVRQTSGYTPRINICDNAGKSDLIFALAYLLNIEIWPRLNSKQNLKLWGVSKNRTYTHIQPAIAGIIEPKVIDDGWIDMMWIIASIVEGVAPPSLIAQHLIKSPKHSATKGFNEHGKILRSSYMLQFGTDMSLRHLVMRYVARRENWNMFSKGAFPRYSTI